MECTNLQQNVDGCTCTYLACDKRGKCCECIQNHLPSNQLPGCFFPPDVEKTYDRSFARFVQWYQSQAR